MNMKTASTCIYIYTHTYAYMHIHAHTCMATRRRHNMSSCLGVRRVPAPISVQTGFSALPRGCWGFASVAALLGLPVILTIWTATINYARLEQSLAKSEKKLHDFHTSARRKQLPNFPPAWCYRFCFSTVPTTRPLRKN